MMTKDKISEAKPYVERALKDEEFRQNLLAAFAAARDVYGDLVGDRGVSGIASRVASDREIQSKLRETVDELRHATERLQGKDDHKSRNTMLLLTGITLGILFNPMTGPQTRQWLKEKVFGPEEDFTYSGGSSYEPTPATDTEPATTGASS